MEDAGCSDMYAVIDEVLDVVDTAKKSEKAKLLNKIYKAYFPKSAKAEPATDEEVESAMDTHHLDGTGEEAIEDEAEKSESSEEPADEDDEESEENENEGVTLGDVRKPEEDYVAAAANGSSENDEEDDEDEGEELEEGLYDLANRSRVLGDMKRTSVMSDEELDRLYNDAIRPEYRAIDPDITDELHRAVAAAKHDGAGEDEFFERTIKQARFYSRKLREDLDEIDSFEGEGDTDRFADGFADDVDLFKRDSAAGIDEDDLEFSDEEEIDEDFDEFDPALDSEDEMADFPVPAQAEMGNYPVGQNESLQDAAEELIADLISSGIDNDEDLIEAIVQEFSDPEHPMERGMASDILEDYYEMNDPANEEATEGDMEQEYEDMVAEGYPDADIIQKLTKKYGLTRHEIEMSLGGAMTRNRMPEPVGEVDEYPTVDDEEDEFEPEEGENGLPFSERE